ncbi:DUF1837 domain-containing protein [Flavobacterium sp. AG291]|uniref:HamA C-terminal domain-containing protein n=1 Tax=Flavobacterium sp. AG291 TaxID=2184000 RepID=UPI000E0C6000|nr:DUF1837 domain-containing protein [Flavobacterium sp. AG291]RDI14430.1 uncharacterized protein DUF1837 [Flavobacterium sp. AG291]
MTAEELNKLRSCTKMFMNHVYWFQQSFGLLPNREHLGTSINFLDLQEFRDEFCEELINTIPEWVYSNTKAECILNDLLSEGRSTLNAQSALRQNTFKKFRNSDSRDITLQGQFGELLLFNFLQHFFDAIPLLRKMPITTSTAMERFGADAIHYNYKDGKNLFFLGEAKTYTANYRFNQAIKDAIESILNTYKNHRKEMGLYIYDSFISDELIEIARSYKNGTLKEAEIHLVSIITYSETKTFEKKSEKQIKEEIEKIVADRGAKVERAVFEMIDIGLHPRFNYIIFPVWDLDQLIIQFQNLIGK